MAEKKRWMYPARAAARDVAIGIKMLDIEVVHLISQLELQVIQGVPKAEILRQIKNKEGIYAAWANRQLLLSKEIIIKNTVKPAEDFAKQNPQQLFWWRLGTAKVHCDKCEEYAGWGPMTLEKWESETGTGIPAHFGCCCYYQLSSVTKAELEKSKK